MSGITQEQLLWRIIEKLNEGINSQHETIKFLMEKRIEQRQWVGLTDNEADEVYMAAQKQINEHWESGGTTIMFPTMLYKAIEAKLKEKNGG